ncbi:glycosyltransferase [Falsirhodobacter deserti]|uniref:glycosyltransferase n=1 Tax=Falsirhodobacter deserti TaxID=1365611 RepID=UPI001F4E22F1|nr:glycosyltransferase [Falsirhodobacter deserti]
MILQTARRLFARFALRHLTIALPGPHLRDVSGKVVGHVDQVIWSRGSVTVTGWTAADQISLLSANGISATTRPNLPRRDVAQAMHLPDTIGFSLTATAPDLDAALLIHGLSGQTMAWALPAPSLVQRRAAQLRLLPSFAMRVGASLPDAARWKRGRDQAARSRIKRRLGLDDLPTAHVLDARQLQPGAPAALPASPTIILPVYNAFDLLPEVLDRVVRHTDMPFHLVIVEDCSSDPSVRPFLRDWCAGRDNVELVENKANLGFIGSVNKAFEIARKRGEPVILLNSDAFVPAGWTSRLLRPLADPTVATVTPMSNDAEIFSVPRICTRTPLQPGEADALDQVAQRFGEAADVEAPTGVGFCMAMQMDFLRRIPAFDPVFGRGYGEEVDWCQKTRALGGRHIGIGSLFVEHRGGESFGSDAKLALVQANNRIVSERYPKYDLEVQRFIQDDPLRTVRLALAIGFAGARASGAVPVHLAHSLGGGAEMYLQARLKEDLQKTGAAIVLRVGGAVRWRVEVHLPDAVTAGMTDDDNLMLSLLNPLPARHVVYGCGVGDLDPATLPSVLLRLAARPQDRLDLLFHDYFPLSPSYCLLDEDGMYRGAEVSGSMDAAHIFRRRGDRPLSLREWQDAWHAAAHESTEITVFSDDSRRHVAAVWPDVAARIQVRPHRLRHTPASIPAAGNAVGVLGNIGAQKGAAVVVELGRRLEGRKLVVIGDFDPAFPLPSHVIVNGAYDIQTLPALVQKYGIGCWLIPSIWPETFSFTTHEALATGLPVLCFDLGAQGEAVRAAPNGYPVPFHGQEDLAGAVVQKLAAIPLKAGG